MLDYCTSSTDPYLTTTAAVKAALFGATATTTAHDARLDALILRASDWANGVVGYELNGVRSLQETVPAYGTPRLMLGVTPVRAIRRFYDSTDTGTATTMLSSEYRLHREAGFIERTAGFQWTAQYRQDVERNIAPNTEEEPWLVDYVAGYTYAGVDTGSANWSTAKGTTSTGRTLPHDVEEAVIGKVVAMFEGSEDVSSERVGDLAINYRSGGFDAAHVDAPSRALLRYRRWA